MRRLWPENEHVPAILAGSRQPMFSQDGCVTVGGPDEASFYFAEFGLAWHRTPGAVVWLTRATAALQRTTPTVH